MATWANHELTRIERAEELRISPLLSDGTPRDPLPIWVVREGDDLYVRSFRGSAGAWYRAARSTREGRIRSGGVVKDVTFVGVTDAEVNDRIDAAYRAKYSRYGARYVDPLLAARDTTLKLVPVG
ncbi:DUF2255 family protein [Streptomyces humi]|uniref:DUF2255 family protein n=1 Tax=Streptomyces humi TaxID=1428620 RepID=UPI000628996A|nr:DUF2255 family protein [Streptomyces humi]